MTTLYALKRLPDNLSAVLDTLDNDIAKVTDFNTVLFPVAKANSWLLSLDEDRIPEHTLSVILMMISGYGSIITLNYPAVHSASYDLNQLYPHVMRVYPVGPNVTTMKILKGRGGYQSGDTIHTYAHGNPPSNERSDTVPDETRDLSGEIPEPLKDLKRAEITSDTISH